MRTTLTIDDDIARLLRQQIRRSGDSLKKVVNHFLRLGLTNSSRPSRHRFVVTPHKLGLPPGLTYDNVAELLETLEGPTQR